MGVVYLAHDTRLHRAVALKALPPHLFSDDRMRARLRQEARAAAALSHPSIATVYALEEIDDQIFIASEYLEGRDAARRARRRSAAGEPARSTSRATIAAALQAAHDRGIVHRDLKPENIILHRRTAVKILDFGLAQFDVAAQDLASVTRLTDPGVMAGTPPYMAPEQLLGQPTSARTDQFAFGVLLYEMLTGRHPFGSGALPTTIAESLSAAIPSPTDDPASLWSIINRAIAEESGRSFRVDERILSRRCSAASAARSRTSTSAPSAPGTSAPHGTLAPQAPTSWWADAPTDRGARLLVHGVAGVARPQVDRRYGVLTFLATLGDRDRRRQPAPAPVVHGAHLSVRAAARSAPTSPHWSAPPMWRSH